MINWAFSELGDKWAWTWDEVFVGRRVRRSAQQGPIRDGCVEIDEQRTPFIGYRAWGLQKPGLWPRLSSLVVDDSWVPGVTEAVCKNRLVHDVPDEACECGLWAKKDLYDAARYGLSLCTSYSWGGLVVGAVRGWGMVVEHGDEGWRARYADVLGLVGPGQAAPDILRRSMEEVAAFYGVPLCTPDQLVELVQKNEVEVDGRRGR